MSLTLEGPPPTGVWVIWVPQGKMTKALVSLVAIISSRWSVVWPSPWNSRSNIKLWRPKRQCWKCKVLCRSTVNGVANNGDIVSEMQSLKTKHTAAGCHHTADLRIGFKIFVRNCADWKVKLWTEPVIWSSDTGMTVSNTTFDLGYGAALVDGGKILQAHPQEMELHLVPFLMLTYPKFMIM